MDAYVEGIERLRESVDRLKTELGKDAIAVGERIAKLETIPRSLDEFRRRLDRLEETRLTKEQVAEALKHALTEERLRIAEDEKKRRGSHGQNTASRVADIRGRWEFWRAILVQALITGGMIVAAYFALPGK